VTKITKSEMIEGELGQIRPQQRRRAASNVQPAKNHGEPSAQPREHQVG
jgi:hypothetical protein